VGSGLSTLAAAEWAGGRLEAPWVRTLTIGGETKRKLIGDFGADLVLSGVGAADTGKTLGAAGIKGSVAPSVWDVAGKIGAVTVGGTVGATGQPWELKNATALASLTLGDVTDADVTVGGPIGTIRAKLWLDGTIQATKITCIATTGVAAARSTPAVSGEMVTLSRAACDATRPA